MQTEMSSTSDGRTSSSVGHVTSVDLQNGEFWRKPLKEEESSDDDDDDDDDFYGDGGTSSSVEDVLPDERAGQDRGLQIILKEKPKHDDYLYCEDCKSFFINKCDVHGPALFIPDVAVPLGVADRARQTLPPGLEIRKSSIPDAGLGVFNNSDTIPVGAHFGPYQGDTVEREEAMNSPYSWVIQRSERCEKYIDASSEFKSNWMRFVNCSRNAEEQNLVAFQYRGEILYRCCRPIERGHELLVWYHEEFTRYGGISFEYIWNKKCSAKNMDNTQVFTCSLCPLSYTVQIYLHKHIKRCHNEEYVKLFKAGVIGPLPADASSQRRLQRKNYHCSFCGKGFIYQSSLQHHQHFHTAQSLHQCSQCGKSFTLQSSLQLHRRVHATTQEAYECSQCLERFNDQIDLQVHQRSHRGGKPYECSHCGKSFGERGALQRHQHVHTGEKPYHCSECGRSFTQQCNLQKHQRIHTGEKPYQCSHCGKNFSDRCNLQIHQRIHTGEKPYHCSHCGKSFNQQSNLQKHQHIHTGQKPYHCSYCGKSFTQQSNLQKHKRIHTGEKPYHCPQCGKSFNQQSNLQKHQRVHTGEKPYHCSHCGKSFSDRCNLQTHQRTTHR